MKEKIAHLVERFPDHEAIIKALSNSNTRFQDLLATHHDLHRQLSRGDREANPDAERRYRNVEEEIVRLIQGYPLA